MENIIIIAILAVIVGGAVGYIIRSKRKGRKCIGCQYADSCGKKDCGE